MTSLTTFASVLLRNSSKRSISRRFFATQAPTKPLKRTALHPLHLELGGKMVEFAGWEMPVQYPDGILKSHLHCRTNASLFDVSHMAQLKLSGKDRVKFLETLCVADLQALPVGSSKLSVYTNEQGGIIDDTIITNYGDHFFIIVNAGCADKDIAHFRNQISKFSGDVKLDVLNRSLLALQGPKAAEVLQRLVKVDLKQANFMTSQIADVAGVKDCIVTRCGYTGEDGFEISVDNANAIPLAKKFLSNAEVKPGALGERDSLRLEAGLCLYGSDMSDTTPVAGASLAWLIGKRRKEQGGFLGDKIVLKDLKNGVSEKRVGFLSDAIMRHDVTLHDPETKRKVGHVTSGTFSPILKKPIAMGYVETKFSEVGSKLLATVYNKPCNVVVTKMPFVPTRYFKKD